MNKILLMTLFLLLSNISFSSFTDVVITYQDFYVPDGSIIHYNDDVNIPANNGGYDTARVVNVPGIYDYYHEVMNIGGY